MKTKKASDDVDASYQQICVDVVAPDCVRFAVEADNDATAPNFTNGLKTIIDGIPYDHKASITDITGLKMTQATFPANLFTTAAKLNGADVGKLEYVSGFVATDKVTVKRNGATVENNTAKDARFVAVFQRSRCR